MNPSYQINTLLLITFNWTYILVRLFDVGYSQMTRTFASICTMSMLHVRVNWHLSWFISKIGVKIIQLVVMNFGSWFSFVVTRYSEHIISKYITMNTKLVSTVNLFCIIFIFYVLFQRYGIIIMHLQFNSFSDTYHSTCCN